MEARRRWRAVAVAAAVAAVGSATVGVVRSAASNERTSSVFVPIVPCRLLDTRPAPDNLGERSTPLGAGETAIVGVWGEHGRCSIPSTATGVGLNLTALGATADTYLTVYPAGGERPLTSNVNPTAGGAPAANAATVALASDGGLAVYNHDGQVDVVIDVSGYYVPSGGGVGPAGPTGATGAAGAAGGARFGRTIVSITPVDSFTSDFTSIVLGADGNPVIAYYDNNMTALKAAVCADVTCTSSTKSTLDAGGVGQTASVTVGNDGRPVVSYWDAGHGALKVARCNTPTCTSAAITTVASGGLGRTTSIAIGVDGNPVVSHWDYTANALKVSACADPACSTATTTTVDSGNVGRTTSITIGVDGNPVVSYWDYGLGQMKLAVCANPTCTASTTTVVDSGSVGRYSSITIGVDGNPVVSYWDYGLGQTKLAVCADRSCTNRTLRVLDTSGTVGQYTAVVIGADGRPLVTYSDGGALNALKLATCGDASCSSSTLTTLDSGTGIGAYSSMTLGLDGNPVISYWDGSGIGRLMVAKLTRTAWTPNNWGR